MINLLYWVLAIIMFGLVVTIHELGHFWGARLTGVYVVEFAVGFGPKLWSRKAKSGVLYSLRALPLGGYCRFAADDEEGVPEEKAYSRQKVWKRLVISLSGPAMNFLTAIVLLFLLYAAVGLPGMEPSVGKLLPGFPAEAAGFQVGDRIISVNEMPIASAAEASQAIRASNGQPVHFVLERDGEHLSVTVQPQWVESEKQSMIGIEYQTTMVRFGAGTSLKNALIVTGNMSRMIVDVLRDLIFKGEGVEDLSGPIGTVVAIKEQTQSGGLLSYLQLASIISVNLGLFNLLPVPGLDGSKLIFLLLEKIRGKRLDPNKEGMVLLGGFAVMAVVMVLAMYQDIMRLLR